MSLVLLSASPRSDRISDTRAACRVGVKRRGSDRGNDSSNEALMESLLPLLLDRPPEGSGGGVVAGDMSSYVLEVSRDLELEGVLYGVSVGEGKA